MTEVKDNNKKNKITTGVINVSNLTLEKRG